MWLVGVVSQRQVWIVGGIYGCGYQGADVVRMYRCGYWVVLYGVNGYSCYLSLELFCSSIPTSVFIFPPFFYNVLPRPFWLFTCKQHCLQTIK